jgi:GNAT superfamily N-acetyltransferase
MGYQITVPEDPQAASVEIERVLVDFNRRAAGPAGPAFVLVIREDGGEEIIGGLSAYNLWGSFYIGLVVAPEGGRGRGLGRELLARAEAEARRLECRHMWLDTFAFQARPFYEGLGFTVFARIDGSSPQYPRYFMIKPLNGDVTQAGPPPP